MTHEILKITGSENINFHIKDPVDNETLSQALKTVNKVKEKGEEALLEYALKFGDIKAGENLVVSKDELCDAANRLSKKDRELLERSASRIRAFAQKQLLCLKELSTDIEGGTAGHFIKPVQRAGCYAPGGRYNLPSSVLMTAVTAKTAGVDEVWVASPKPSDITLAAAYISGAHALLKTGGAQAIAALAYGAGSVLPCQVVAGPGNRYVTAAKKIVSGHVAIDMLAGPSELVVLADDNADPHIIASDLLAQAEHDPDARPILVSTSKELINKVNCELEVKLKDLPTAQTAMQSLKQNGFAVCVKEIGQAIRICSLLAPEHLELHIDDPHSAIPGLANYGALFIGQNTAEVFGDYAAGPNHTLPTSGTSRYTGGLSVFNFLRIRTWMEIKDISAAKNLIDDCINLAKIEGLEAHARSAQCRKAQDNKKIKK